MNTRSLEQEPSTTGNIYKNWKVKELRDDGISNLISDLIETLSDQDDDDIFEEPIEIDKKSLFLKLEKQSVSSKSYDSKNLGKIRIHKIKSEIGNEQNLSINTEEIHIKSEEEESACTKSPDENLLVKANSFESTNCDYPPLSKHSLKHGRITNKKFKDQNREKSLKCTECSYKTFNRNYLRNHIIRHNQDEADKVKCPHCTYQTVDRSNLRRHIFSHDKTKRETFTCFECSLEVTTKYALKNHIKRHTNPSNTLDGKLVIIRRNKSCQHCDFKTKYKSSLFIHELEHKNANNNVLERQKCQYTRFHGNRQKIVMYKCTDCDYETFHKGNFTRHVRGHKCEVNLYQCYECNYKNYRKDELRNHIVRRHIKFAQA